LDFCTTNSKHVKSHAQLTAVCVTPHHALPYDFAF
jgi:hypothetical protein